MFVALWLAILASLFAICVMIGWVRLELRESSARIHQWWPTRAFVFINATILGVMGLTVLAIEPGYAIAALIGQGAAALAGGVMLVVVCLGVRRTGPRGLRLVAISITLAAASTNAAIWVVVAVIADPFGAMAAYLAPIATVPIGSAIGLGAVVWKLPSVAPKPADGCPSCGYPRAGLNGTARCPECGAAWTASYWGSV
ncbi:MAG: hypothetical protein ACFCBV_01335 [Phycisphaerales bacterium]